MEIENRIELKQPSNSLNMFTDQLAWLTVLNTLHSLSMTFTQPPAAN